MNAQLTLNDAHEHIYGLSKLRSMPCIKTKERQIKEREIAQR